ncbi:MAG: glycosyltransferase family 2 protein [Anaerolineae bacterium]
MGEQQSYPNNEPQIDLSIVIPVFNEADSLVMLHEKLNQALASLDKSYEIILIDDGSIDNSFALLKTLQSQDSHVRVIRFRRNFGQTAAFSAGFAQARGDVIVTMDGDLQNDPADIACLLDKMEEGYDIVSGWRKDRKDKFLTRRLPSILANRLISKSTGIVLHDYGCSLKAYKREVLAYTKLYGEMHRFIPALASQMGVKVAELPVNHLPRQYGRSKYNLKRTLRVILDLLTVKFLLDFATRPMQIFGLFGLATFAAGAVLAVYLTILRLFFNTPLGDRPILLLAIVLIVIGVQLMIMGLIGEMIVRTYYETQDKPIYVIQETLPETMKQKTADQSGENS